MPTSRSRKLAKKSPAKERQIARALFASAARSHSPKALDLAKTLQRSATRKLKRK
jgi:hypothetical protein